MEKIGFPGPGASAPLACWDTRHPGSTASRDADQFHSNFPATLLAMAGHDLRQPLQVITNAHDFLARSVHRGVQREDLARAEDATAKLSRMLGQLVEALQLHERSSDELHTPIALRPILQDLAEEFAEPAHLKEITFRITSARGTALSQPVLLISMLRNLIRNAIECTLPGGCVLVGSRPRASELCTQVRDTGVGIRAGALSAIFRAFQRVDGSRPDGLGLGLFIVKHAADLLGHRVKVRSAEGRGSCFTVVVNTAQCSDSAPTEVEAHRPTT